jgi:hypothetical protein
MRIGSCECAIRSRRSPPPANPISVSPFDLDPGAPPVGFETIARIADRLTRQSIRQNRSRGWTKPFWGTHETALKQSGRMPACKERRF